MALPTSLGPRFLFQKSGVGVKAITSIAEVIGPFRIEGADRVERRVNVWRLAGEAGIGLVAGASEALEDRPGVYRASANAWMVGWGRPHAYTLEVELHSWDAGTYASRTGDRQWLEVPKRRMYAERDRRTAELAAEFDRSTLQTVPLGHVPALMAGLGPEQVRALAERHAPALLGAAAGGGMTRCRWAIDLQTVATRCALGEHDADRKHEARGYPRFPGGRITWQPSDSREFQTDRPDEYAWPVHLRASGSGGASKASDTQPAPTWGEFEGRLASVLSQMAVDTYLVLSTPIDEGGSTYYVQFAQGGRAGFLAEAVSNAHLAGNRAMSPAQEEQLGDLGWQSPAPRAKRDLNFSREWPMPVPWEEVVRLAMRTLREVYGIESPGELRYRRFAKGGPDFAEPDLGIRAEAPGAPRQGGLPGHPSLAELQPLVESALKAFLQVDELPRDKDGDIPIRAGSAVVFVRTRDGTPPTVQIFSPIVRDIDGRPAVLQALNDVNSTISIGRVFWIARVIVVATEVAAVGITQDHLAFACLQLGGLADRLDDELRVRLATAGPEGERILVN